MAAYESGDASPLQGVSQQIVRARQPGQVTAQENMLSDPVTGLRRRPGVEHVFDLAMTGSTADKVLAWFVDIGGVNLHVLLNTSDGQIKLLSEAYAVLETLAGGAYLTTSNRKSIRAAVVGDELFLLNTEKIPAVVAPGATLAPTSRGFFFVVSGAYNKKFEVTVTSASGTISASYTTPTGAGAGDAALSTAAYIAGQLHTQLAAAGGAINITPYVLDAYIYIASTVTGVLVESSSGTLFTGVSKDSYVTVESSLPAKLPAEGDGYVMRVGDIKLPKYYTYQHSTRTWRESGEHGAPAALSNMPVSILNIAGTWTLATTNFEGRGAGDSESNPTPRFVGGGISGMGAYQGRLVLLSGPQVCMSASSKSRRMYRTTLTSLLDSDTIQVGSSANSSASYEYAVPFQKDLLLFSAKYQAIIPSSNLAITPRTATVLVTSTYTSDMNSSPVPMGRTLMYPTPRSADFFGIMEMLPSSQADSLYMSFEATPHLPKYMGGNCRFSASSTVANLVVFGTSLDKNAVFVHEYQWDGDTKSQKAWHRWTFPYEVATAYFAGDLLHVVFVGNAEVVLGVIDARAGTLTETADSRPFLDLYVPATITDHNVPIPAWLTTLDPTITTTGRLVERTGELAGSLVGATGSGSNFTTVLSHPSGPVYIGVPYESVFSPSTPLHRDRDGKAITTNKVTLQRYILSTQNSGDFQVLVRDASTPAAEGPYDPGVLFFSSSELTLGETPVAEDSQAVVPCRTDTYSTTLAFSTNGPHELNVVGLDYVLKVNQKIRRR